MDLLSEEARVTGPNHLFFPEIRDKEGFRNWFVPREVLSTGDESMKISRSFGALAVIALFWVAMVHGAVSCSNGPKTCTKKTEKTDCSAGQICFNKVCRKSCSDDQDCKSLGLKCSNGYCGGTALPDAGPKDEGPKGECEEGAIEDCYSGKVGTKGVGECRGGKRTCTEGKWSECVGEVTPKAEECDGKDNDCDTNVDNNCGTTCTPKSTRSCYTGVSGTKGVGPCKSGKETCGEDGTWGQCEGQVLPVPENCGTKADDNCDGKVNEGCACTPGASRDCRPDGGCAGIQTCNRKAGGGGTEWGKCLSSPPSSEKCDKLDNDCDGKVDNIKGSDKPLTRKCNNEPCKQEGVETCTKGEWKNCTGLKPEKEKCDGKDNDCDGKIDNIEFTDKKLIQGCDSGKPGLCKNGQRFCEKGKFGECIAPKPKKEDCNDFDDDCDGKTDEAEDKPCGDMDECIKDTLGVKKCVPK